MWFDLEDSTWGQIPSFRAQIPYFPNGLPFCWFCPSAMWTEKCEHLCKKSEIQKTGSCDCALGHVWGPRIGSGWVASEGLKIIGTPLRGAQNVRSGGVPFLINKNVNKAVSSRGFDDGKPALRSVTWTWTSLRCRLWVEITHEDTIRILCTFLFADWISAKIYKQL